jgi:hypothetical protein
LFFRLRPPYTNAQICSWWFLEAAALNIRDAEVVVRHRPVIWSRKDAARCLLAALDRFGVVDASNRHAADSCGLYDHFALDLVESLSNAVAVTSELLLPPLISYPAPSYFPSPDCSSFSSRRFIRFAPSLNRLLRTPPRLL